MAKTSDEIIMTTGDLHQDYYIVGPVYSCITENSRIIKYELLEDHGGFKCSDIENSTAASLKFEDAFFASIQALRTRAYHLGADAVIDIRFDVNHGNDKDADPKLYFQMYGTAVKFPTKY